MQIDTEEAGRFPVAIAAPSSFLILAGNDWVFGQLVFVALQLGAPRSAVGHFEKVFLAGLAEFGETIGVSAPWADKLAEWADEEADGT
jgi:hypothetical protein